MGSSMPLSPMCTHAATVKVCGMHTHSSPPCQTCRYTGSSLQRVEVRDQYLVRAQYALGGLVSALSCGLKVGRLGTCSHLQQLEKRQCTSGTHAHPPCCPHVHSAARPLHSNHLLCVPVRQLPSQSVPSTHFSVQQWQARGRQ